VFTEERAQHLASTFGCIVGQLPFTYLGLPLGTTRPAVADFLPLVCRIERRMAGISSLLSYHGRLIYWLILFFHLCPCTGSAPFPKTVIKQIDSFRKNCLWDGKDLHRHGKCLVPWTLQPVDQRIWRWPWYFKSPGTKYGTFAKIADKFNNEMMLLGLITFGTQSQLNS